jgi:hypothetical protein
MWIEQNHDRAQGTVLSFAVLTFEFRYRRFTDSVKRGMRIKKMFRQGVKEYGIITALLGNKK